MKFQKIKPEIDRKMKNDSESSTFTSVSEQDERKVNVNDCKDLKKFENMSQIAVPGIRKQDLSKIFKAYEETNLLKHFFLLRRFSRKTKARSIRS